MTRTGGPVVSARVALLAAAAVFLAPLVPAQLPNDDCATAIQIFDGVNAGFTTLGSVTTAGLPFVCSNGPNPDVWFTYTATCTGSVTFSTCVGTGGMAGYDAAISAYSGVCGSLTLLGCNDNLCGPSPELTVYCIAVGQTILVRVAGWQGATGSFDLAVACNPPLAAPPNDDCGGAIPVAAGLNPFLTNDGATPSVVAPFSCAPGGTDVWYSYMATCTGLATFSLCAPGTASFNVLLSVYSGGCGALAELGCSDDVCGNAPRVSVPVTTGTSYLVRVGGAGACALTGTFDLDVSCAPPLANDDCAGAIPAADGLNAFLTNVGASDGAVAASCGTGASPGFMDAWYAYTATCAGVVRVDTCNATGPPTLADTMISVYDGCGGSELACNDNAVTVCSPGSSATFTASAGTTYRIRIASAAATASGTFNLMITCNADAAALDDYGDAPVGPPDARHTGAGQERLGSTVSAEGGPRSPAWFGDASDDGIVSVSNISPGTTTAQIVVSAVNPTGTQTDFCRIWVRRTGLSAIWSAFGDGLPSQSASVGSSPVSFTFGPFAITAANAPSPSVRVRLSRDAAGVSSPSATGAFGEVEDHVVAGTGGINLNSLAGSPGADAGDAALPYPPAGTRNIANERLGTVVSPDGFAPVGFPTAGTAAWDDDPDDDGIVRIDGLRSGASAFVQVRGTNPVSATLDAARAWFDFNGDGDWDDPGEATPLEMGVVPAIASGATFTLGPLAVPGASVDPVPTRIKLVRPNAEAGHQAAGASASFGEIEDYLLHLQRGSGCNMASGVAPAAWADDPPRIGLPFVWRLAGLAPSTAIFLTASVTTFPAGIDFALLGLPIPPGTCFLYVSPANVFALAGLSDPSGDAAITIAVPPNPVLAGGVINLQGFQVAPPFSLVATNYLALGILP